MSAVDPVAVLAALSPARILGMGFLSFGVAGAVALVHRTYLGERVPRHVALIAALGAVGLWMNTASAIVAFVESTTTETPVVFENVETNVAALAVATAAALPGARSGDRLAPNLRALTGARQVEVEVSKLVRTVGRFIAVKLPKADDVETIPDYEAVAPETVAAFAGVELLFPRGLTVDQLHDRVVARLREDYGVGNVDLDLSAEGEVEYLAVGSRAAGIGPTLPPRQAAVAVAADPAPGASPGDRVQVFRRGEEGARHVATADLRAVAGDTATLTVDRGQLDAIDQSAEHRLVTLPASRQPDREFAALLRAANETMAKTTVAADGALVGVPMGALRPAVVAVRPAEGAIVTLPGRFRVCQPGDRLYAVGRHDELRKLEAVAASDGEAEHTDSATGSETDTGGGAASG